MMRDTINVPVFGPQCQWIGGVYVKKGQLLAEWKLHVFLSGMS